MSAGHQAEPRPLKSPSRTITLRRLIKRRRTNSDQRTRRAYGNVVVQLGGKRIALIGSSAHLFPVSPFRRKPIHRRAQSAIALCCTGSHRLRDTSCDCRCNCERQASRRKRSETSCPCEVFGAAERLQEIPQLSAIGNEPGLAVQRDTLARCRNDGAPVTILAVLEPGCRARPSVGIIRRASERLRRTSTSPTGPGSAPCNATAALAIIHQGSWAFSMTSATASSDATRACSIVHPACLDAPGTRPPISNPGR